MLLIIVYVIHKKNVTIWREFSPEFINQIVSWLMIVINNLRVQWYKLVMVTPSSDNNVIMMHTDDVIM